jgi:hypothetical protein
MIFKTGLCKTCRTKISERSYHQKNGGGWRRVSAASIVNSSSSAGNGNGSTSNDSASSNSASSGGHHPTSIIEAPAPAPGHATSEGTGNRGASIVVQSYRHKRNHAISVAVQA